MALLITHLGPNQLAALGIYVLDEAALRICECGGSCVLCDDDGRLSFPGELIGPATLRIDDEQDALAALVEGANSADNDGDTQLCNALIAIQRRIPTQRMTP